MHRKLFLCLCIGACLLGFTGCGKQTPKETETVPQQTEAAGVEASAQNDTGARSAQNQVGGGFKPPAGSHVDSKGHIVDKEGNTFDKEGGWQVPEGGHVDSQGRIIDKDGNVMGGGATIGSKG